MRSTSASPRSGGTFDLPRLEKRAAELSEQAAAPGFWNDAEKALNEAYRLSDKKLAAALLQLAQVAAVND